MLYFIGSYWVEKRSTSKKLFPHPSLSVHLPVYPSIHACAQRLAFNLGGKSENINKNVLRYASRASKMYFFCPQILREP